MPGEIVQVEPRRLPAVALVHSRAFPASALTQLGPEAVRRYYDWQLTGPHEHQFIASVDETGLLGFGVGGVARAALAGFVQKNKRFLLGRVLVTPRLVLSARGWRAMVSATKALRRLRALADAPPQEQRNGRSFGILAIAVDPACQGKGVGSQLMARFESIARRQHFSRMHLTVSVSNKSAICFYERLAWTKVSASGGWAGAMEKILS